jgi:hypothetical protein
MDADLVLALCLFALAAGFAVLLLILGVSWVIRKYGEFAAIGLLVLFVLLVTWLWRS